MSIPIEEYLFSRPERCHAFRRMLKIPETTDMKGIFAFFKTSVEKWLEGKSFQSRGRARVLFFSVGKFSIG